MGNSLLSIDNVAGGEERPVEVDRGVRRLVVEGDLGQAGTWPPQKRVSGPEAARSPTDLGINGKILQIIHNGIILLINKGLFVLWLFRQNFGNGGVATNTKHLKYFLYPKYYFFFLFPYLSSPGGHVAACVKEAHHPGVRRWKVIDLEMRITVLDLLAKTRPRSILVTWK